MSLDYMKMLAKSKTGKDEVETPKAEPRGAEAIFKNLGSNLTNEIKKEDNQSPVTKQDIPKGETLKPSVSLSNSNTYSKDPDFQELFKELNQNEDTQEVSEMDLNELVVKHRDIKLAEKQAKLNLTIPSSDTNKIPPKSNLLTETMKAINKGNTPTEIDLELTEDDGDYFNRDVTGLFDFIDDNEGFTIDNGEEEELQIQSVAKVTVGQRDLDSELKNLTFNRQRIVHYPITDVTSLVRNYLGKRDEFTYDITQEEFSISDLITTKVEHRQIKRIVNIMNIQENIKQFDKSKATILSELTKAYSDFKNSSLTEKNDLVQKINSASHTDVKAINDIYDEEIDFLDDFKEGVIAYLEATKSVEVTQEMNKHTKMFQQSQQLTSEIEGIKETIGNVLGKNFTKVKRERIKIPKTHKGMQALLNRVNKEIDMIEIEDKSYYDKVMTKVMKFIFAPSRYTTNDLHSIIVLLNTLLFLYLAIKFKNIVVLAIVTTIMIDLFKQLKLAKKNRNVDFLLEFAMKSDDIIKAIQESITHEKRKEVEESNSQLIGEIDHKIQKLINEMSTLVEEKESQIKTNYNKDSLTGKVKEHYKGVMGTSDRKHQNYIAQIESGYKRFKELLDVEMNLAEAEATKLKVADIYADGNKKSLTYNTSYKVGELVSPDGKYRTDYRRAFPEGSYLIHVEDDEEKERMLGKVKCLVIQQLSHIKPEFLTVNFIDVRELGNDLIEMISENEKITKLISNEDTVSEYLKHAVKEIEVRYKTATKDYPTITDYNLEMIEKRDTTFKYEINVFYNFDTELVKNVHFRTLMTEGGKSGITNVVFITDEDTLDQRGEPDQDILNNLDCFDYEVEKLNKWTMVHSNKTDIAKGAILADIAPLTSESIEFNRNDMLMKVRNIEEIADEDKKGLIYYSELKDAYVPKLFEKNTLKGIELCAGFLDGNMTKPEPVVLGDDLVHALMGGATGSGKSNQINVILMNLIRSYSPEWLELYMIDFKNVEFNFYTRIVETPNYKKKVSMIPHTSMIAGTTDPDYALSVFEHALTEMERRKRLLAKGITHNGENNSFKKIETYNRYTMDNNLKDKHPIIPRILIVLDEFQVMFKMEDDNALSKIKNNIARLAKEARAMGIHMFFTSQTMDGTLPEDIKEQFMMRFCLSASATTSKDVLGNDASSTLPPKGFVYMSGSAERKKEDNKLYKVPFIPEDYNKATVEEVWAEAKKLHEANPLIPFYETDFYDEKDIHSERELKAYLSHEAIKQQRNAVLLGPKVIYKDKSLPEHFMVGNNDTENIIVAGNEKVYVANLINSLINNFSSKDRTRLIIANFDRTMDGFIDESKTADGLDVFNRISDPLPLLESVSDLIGVPYASEFDPDDIDDMDGDEHEEFVFNPAVDNRWYLIIIGLNKADGFNADYIEDNYMSPLINILKQGPAKGLTTVINYKPPFRMTKILPQCSYRVASKVDDDTSYELFNSRKGKSLFTEDELAFGMFRSTINDAEAKFKIYNFDYSSDLLAPKELEDVAI